MRWEDALEACEERATDDFLAGCALSYVYLDQGPEGLEEIRRKLAADVARIDAGAALGSLGVEPLALAGITILPLWQLALVGSVAVADDDHQVYGPVEVELVLLEPAESPSDVAMVEAAVRAGFRVEDQEGLLRRSR